MFYISELSSCWSRGWKSTFPDARDTKEVIYASYSTVCSGYNGEQPRVTGSECVEVAPAIKERMMKKGSMMLSYQPHRGKVNFFRQIIISPQVSREDMDFLLDEIDLLGKDL